MINWNDYQDEVMQTRRSDEITLTRGELECVHYAFHIQLLVSSLIDDALLLDGRDTTPTANSVRFDMAGLIGETGELADIIKKYIFHRQALDRNKLREELGDSFWYLSALARNYSYNMADIMGAGERIGDASFTFMRDIAAHLISIADWFTIPVEEILDHNVRRLQRRYPDGFVEGGGNRV